MFDDADDLDLPPERTSGTAINLAGSQANLDLTRENAVFAFVEKYAGNCPEKRKRATAYVLRVVCGYKLDWIAEFLNDHKGHVSRQIRQFKSELLKQHSDPQMSLFE